MDFDNLHFAAGGGPTSQAFCLGCLRQMQLPVSDRSCPTCGMPVRRVDPDESTALNSLHDRLSQALHARRGNDGAQHTNGTSSDDDEDDDAEDAYISRSDRNRAGTRRNDALPDEAAGNIFDISGMMQALLAGGAGGGAGGDGVLDAGMRALLGAMGAGAGAAGGAGAGAGAGAGNGPALAGLEGLFGNGDAGMLDTALLASLQEAAAGGSAHTPASPATVAALRRIQVKSPKTDIPKACTLKVVVHGAATCELVAIPAAFGPGVPTDSSGHINGSLVGAAPWDGNAAVLANGSGANGSPALKGAAVLFDRGVISFAQKTARAQAAGAAACIVANTHGMAWPYTMTDSKAEAQSLGLTIPTVMVRYEDGQRVKKMLAEPGAQVSVKLSAAPVAEDCAVCCEAWHGVCAETPEGESALQMPCGHLYHEQCIKAWLDKRNTCPLCRATIPEATPDEMAQRAAAAAGSQPGAAGAGAGAGLPAQAREAAEYMRRMQRQMQEAVQQERERERLTQGWYQ